MIIHNMFLIILFTSLFSGLIVTLFGNKIGLLKVYYVYFAFFYIALILLFIQYYNFLSTHPNIDFDLLNVIVFEGYSLVIAFKFDKLTIMMLFVVIFVSFCVCLFSMWYMMGDPNHLKFLNYLNYFMFFMILLVTGKTLLVIFIGWEGIGIFSYLLINFWNDRPNANRSAFKAILVNKIGDSFVFTFISIYIYIFENIIVNSSENYIFFFMNSERIVLNFNVLFLICASLFIAGVAKSAQFTLHVWLPDAMEGPTPVSALLHAATMVTAGAYVIIKFNWIYLLNSNVMHILLFTGILTNFISSLIAIFQYDIKKIVAYSTASQMGLIFVAIGIFKPMTAFFHMYNHAFFKALLFILAGIIIHSLKNKQDLRFVINLNKDKFFLFSGFIVSLFTLLGFPFLSAFYSKDLIIQTSFLNLHFIPNFVNIFLLISVCSTALYSFKIFTYVFKIDKNVDFKTFLKYTKYSLESNYNSIIGIVMILQLFSMYSGYTSFNIFIYEDISFPTNVSQNLELEKLKDSLENEYISAVSIFFMMLAILGYVFAISKELLIFTKFNYYFVKFKNLFSRKFYFDTIYYYITKLSLTVRIVAKEEKVFNETFIIAYFKNKLYRFLQIYNFIFSNRLLSVIFIFYIILDIILFINYTKIFIISVISAILIHLVVKLFKWFWK